MRLTPSRSRLVVLTMLEVLFATEHTPSNSSRTELDGGRELSTNFLLPSRQGSEARVEEQSTKSSLATEVKDSEDALQTRVDLGQQVITEAHGPFSLARLQTEALSGSISPTRVASK
ncbi:hypothetical protein BCR39DRAFT_121678 [Naematelia encephala]|uniref:Uncharacterized protein n=1 Tax=Naematelia encephala TaxID=71784 RepID=A0A1Y2BIU6_9TREE|nr:hypothetical protein BCR39DRAFT_121678 [Naematelia encephala]